MFILLYFSLILSLRSFSNMLSLSTTSLNSTFKGKFLCGLLSMRVTLDYDVFRPKIFLRLLIELTKSYLFLI